MQTTCPECQADIALPDPASGQPLRCPLCYALIPPELLGGADVPEEIAAARNPRRPELDLSDLDAVDDEESLRDPELSADEEVHSLDGLDDLDDVDDLDSLDDLDDLDDFDDLDDLGMSATDRGPTAETRNSGREHSGANDPDEAWDEPLANEVELPPFSEKFAEPGRPEPPTSAPVKMGDELVDWSDEVPETEEDEEEHGEAENPARRDREWASNERPSSHPRSDEVVPATPGDEVDFDDDQVRELAGDSEASVPFQFVAAGREKMAAAPAVPRRSNILGTAVKALVGGVLAMFLLQLLCWWLLGMDPLGFASQVPKPVAFVVPAKVRRMYGLLPTQQPPLRPDIVVDGADEDPAGEAGDETHLDSLEAMENLRDAAGSETAGPAAEPESGLTHDSRSPAGDSAVLAGLATFDEEAVVQDARGTAGFHDMLLQAIQERAAGLRNVAREWYTQYCELAKSATLASADVPADTLNSARELLQPIAENAKLLSLVETSAAGWLNSPDNVPSRDMLDSASVRGVVMAGTLLSLEPGESWIRGRLKIQDKHQTEVVVVQDAAGIAEFDRQEYPLQVGDKLLLMGVQLFSPDETLPGYSGRESYVVVVTDMWIKVP